MSYPKRFIMLVWLTGLQLSCQNGSPEDIIQPPIGSFSATPTKVWDKTFGGSSSEKILSMVATSDGGFLLGGYSFSGQDGNKSDSNRGHSDMWVVKIDGNGTKVWDKTFGGSNSDDLNFMIATSDGGFLLGGDSRSGQDGNKSDLNRGSYDYWVVKIDGSGTKVWDKTFGGSGDEQISSVVATSDGGFLLGGFSDSGQDGNKSDLNRGLNDMWVVKIDGSGTKMWDKTFGGSGNEQIASIIATSDGGFLLGGDSDSGQDGNKSAPNRGKEDYWVVKIDGSGTKVWDKTFGGSSSEDFSSMIATSDGGFLLGGDSRSGQDGDKSDLNRDPNRNYDDYWVVKIDGSGTKVWDKTFGGSSSDGLFSIVATSDGGFLLGGDSVSGLDGDKSAPNRGYSDMWVVKIDGNGTKVWDKTFGGSSYENLYAIIATSDGGFLLGGESFSGLDGNKSDSNRGLNDMWVVKIK